ncbi:LysR family transcriptional regulator [Sneathiella aquimaris]|uniref:LysR family transcriptional regulator n=1 Tax=Sneathiella aquimaris TaxID=2599305 RepID=UPI00146D642B|nr:LysR family transcriptional regulator [Sneathiella aquimaris]
MLNIAKNLCKNAHMEDWDSYKFILAVGRHGSLSAAARSLSVNHTTVSRRITAIEEKMNVRLFDRIAKNFVPTDAGHKAIASSERIEKEVFALRREIASKDSEIAGPLQITVADQLYQTYIADIVHSFMALYPQIDITVRTASENFNLSKREADVAIRVGDQPDTHLFGRRIMRQNRCFYISDTYLSHLQATDGTIDKSTNIKFINHVEWSSTILDELKKVYPGCNEILKTDAMIVLLTAVKKGVGVSRLPCFLGESDPDLVQLPGCTPTKNKDIWALTHPDLKNVSRIRLFMQFVSDRLKNHTDIFLGKG